MRGLGRVLSVGVGLLGFTAAASVDPPSCECIVRNERVEPADSCLTIDMRTYCVGATVRNDCGVAVTLVDWPLKELPCANSPTCTVALPAGQETHFNFGRTQSPENAGTTSREVTYSVRMGDAEAQPFTISADVQCTTLREDEDGCAAAPGALAALGVLAMVPALRRSRRG